MAGLLGGLLRLVLRDTATRAADLQAPVLGFLDLLAGGLLLLLLVVRNKGRGGANVKKNSEGNALTYLVALISVPRQFLAVKYTETSSMIFLH